MKRQRFCLKERVSFPFSLFFFHLFPKKTFASRFTIRDFAILAQLLSFSFYLFSCSTPTESSKVTYSGTVTLEDTTDFSGVTVFLYAPVELDTALVRINEQYPNIGVQISQETEFDHREHEPLYTTATAADGSWEIKAPKGKYNLVVEKEGWGWKYEFYIPDKVELVKLKKELYLNNISNSNYVFENDFIVVNEDFVVNEGMKWQFRGNNIVVFAENCKLVVLGYVDFKYTKKILFSTANRNINGKILFENIDTLNLNNIVIGKNIGVVISNSDDIAIQNCLINSKLEPALKIKSGALNILNCIFRNGISGLNISGSPKIVVQNIIFFDLLYGLEFYSAGKGFIKNNLFQKCEHGLNLVRGNYIVENNVFENCTIGIEVKENNTIEIARNIFKNNDFSIRTFFISHSTSPIIMKAINNNFYNDLKFAIYVDRHTLTIPLDAHDNYWDTNSAPVIMDKIFDKYDNPGHPGWTENQYVIFEPFLIVPIDNAGL